MYIEHTALVVDDYDNAIQFFVDASPARKRERGSPSDPTRRTLANRASPVPAASGGRASSAGSASSASVRR